MTLAVDPPRRKRPTILHNPPSLPYATRPSTTASKLWRASNVWPGLKSAPNPGHTLPTLSLGVGTNASGRCVLARFGCVPSCKTWARSKVVAGTRGKPHPGHSPPMLSLGLIPTPVIQGIWHARRNRKTHSLLGMSDRSLVTQSTVL